MQKKKNNGMALLLGRCVSVRVAITLVSRTQVLTEWHTGWLFVSAVGYRVQPRAGESWINPNHSKNIKCDNQSTKKLLEIAIKICHWLRYWRNLSIFIGNYANIYMYWLVHRYADCRVAPLSQSALTHSNVTPKNVLKVFPSGFDTLYVSAAADAPSAATENHLDFFSRIILIVGGL